MTCDRDAITANRTKSRHAAARLLLLLLPTVALGAPAAAAVVEKSAVAVQAERPVATTATLSLAPSLLERRNFRLKVLAKPTPHHGCFVAHYPNPAWVETPCGTPPKTPNPRALGALPNTVGGGTDFFTQDTGKISSATGSFDAATGTSPEYGTVGEDMTTVHPNAYALQLNANTFSTSACAGSSGCTGWEQFIYSQTQCGAGTSCIFIEYWLLYHANPCPSGQGWHYWNGAGNTVPGCFLNTAYKDLPFQPLTGLGSLALTGSVSGGNDQISVSVAGGDVYQASNASIAGLGQGWNSAEYNLVGDCCNGEAYFTGNNASITVRLASVNGTTSAPTCTSSFSGETAERNNLNLVGGCGTVGGGSPAIVFTESGGGPVPPGVSIGDPHFTTFQGGHYTFMGNGEYILAKAGDLTVQARQSLISAPSAPAIAVNAALAVKIGTAQVGIYPTSVEVNGSTVQLADTHAIGLGGGAVLARAGNLYTISRPSGDIIQARTFPGRVDISVKLGAGTDMSKASGLLVSAPGAGIAALLRNGVAVRGLQTLAALHDFAQSWQIQHEESLFHAAGRPEVRPLANLRPLMLTDLEAPKRDAARKTCAAAGVSDATLLDDCTLDVAATGDKTLADGFVFQPKPKVVFGPRIAVRPK
jgi:hypothetical protein